MRASIVDSFCRVATRSSLMHTFDATASALPEPLSHRQRGSVPDTTIETDLLQQWVQHGRQCADATVTLVSAWNDNHKSATNQLVALMSTQDSHLLRNPSSNTTFPPRIVVSRDHASRSSLRALRAHKRRLIGRYERQKKSELLQRQQQEMEKAKRDKAAAEVAEAEAAERQRRHQEEAEERARKQRCLEEEQKAAAAKARDEEDKRRAAEENAKVLTSPSSSPPPSKAPFEASPVAPFVAPPPASAPPPPKGDARFQAQYKAWMEGPSKEWVEDYRVGENGFHDAGLEEIWRILDVYEKFRETADVFRKDSSMKQPRLALKKTINKAVNQISCTIAQVQWVIRQLCTVFQNVGSLGMANAYPFAVHEIASRLVTEADSTVSSNMDFAFGVGAIIVGITANAPNIQEMHDVVLGTFYQHCVFTRPHFPTRNKGEDAKKFRLRMGYREDETEEEFSQRVRGCMNLFGAIYQTELSSLKMQFSVRDNPYSLCCAWTWLARVVNRRQRTLAPEVVYAFLETAGYRMSEVYKTQFAKLVKVMQKVVLVHCSPYASRLSLTNLEIWIDDFERNGHRVVEPPPGRNLPMRDVVNT